MPGPTYDPRRRRLLTGCSPGIAPPWADAAKLFELCSGCGACAAACPQGIVVSDGGHPSVDFRRGECTFCGACAGACPAPIFGTVIERPWTLVADIRDSCFAFNGIVCQSCRDSCPESAIRFELAFRSAPRPRVDAQACTGCGACAAGCPAEAIEIGEPVRV
jgi:ferredoxin-type protein NapF